MKTCLPILILSVVTYFSLLGLVFILTALKFGVTEPEKVQTLFETAVEALEKVAELCKGPENAQIAVKHGVVEASLQSYHALKSYRTTWASLALRLLLSVIAGDSLILKLVVRKHYHGAHTNMLFLFLPQEEVVPCFFRQFCWT